MSMPDVTPRPVSDRHRRRVAAGVTAVAVAAGSLLLAAGAAQSAATRHDGVVVWSSVLNCDSVIWGTPYHEAGVGAVASVVYDDQVPLRAGDVFHVSVEVSAVGNPYPCLDQSMRPDLVLPVGIELAVSATHPIRCLKWDYLADPVVATPETALCPVAPQGPESGGTIGLGTATGGIWSIPNGTGYEIQVPVVATARGIKTFTFPSRIVDGNSNPILRPVSGPVQILPAVETPGTPSPQTPTPTPTPTIIVEPQVATSVSTEVAPVVRLSRTRGTVPVRVQVNKAGSRVRLAFVVRWRGRTVGVASRNLTLESTDATTTKVKVPATWRARLAGKRVRAVLTSQVSAPDRTTASAAESFVVKGARRR